MIDGKELEQSINTFKGHVQQMGKTADIYMQLIDYREQMDQTNHKVEEINTTLSNNIVLLEEAKQSIDTQLQQNEANRRYIEQWQGKMQEVMQSNNEIKNYIGESRKDIHELEIHTKENLHTTSQDIGKRIDQFVDMQIQLNKNISSDISNFKENVSQALQQLSTEHDEQKKMIETHTKKLENITKLVFINICVSIIILGIVFMQFIGK